MINITNQLEEFSDKYRLWDTSLNEGRNSLEQYFKDEPQECVKHFGDYKLEDIQFVRRKQQLIFNDGNATVFIVSTLYSLVIENTNADYGYYALDVDKNGKLVDDWLVFK